MLLTTQGLFMHKKLYKQIDGITIGCLLGPATANFLLDCVEQKLFGNKSGLFLAYGLPTL